MEGKEEDRMRNGQVEMGLEQELIRHVKPDYANCLGVKLEDNYIICHQLCRSRREFETAVEDLAKVWSEIVRGYGRYLGGYKWHSSGLRISLGFEPETSKELNNEEGRNGFDL